MFEFLVLYGGTLIQTPMISNCETNYLNMSSVSVCDDNIINFSEKLQKNLDIIDSFKNFDDNWNDYGALKFSVSVLNNARSALYFLDRQPDVFPTGRNSVQFEYEKLNGDYLEFEIFEDSIIAFQIISDKETECNVNEAEMRKMVVDFYG